MAPQPVKREAAPAEPAESPVEKFIAPPSSVIPEFGKS